RDRAKKEPAGQQQRAELVTDHWGCPSSSSGRCSKEPAPPGLNRGGDCKISATFAAHLRSGDGPPAGGRSRTQRPQFQPRRLLQCQPGPQPSAIRSTRCAIPIPNNVGCVWVGPAGAGTVTKATKTTDIIAIARIPTPNEKAHCNGEVDNEC